MAWQDVDNGSSVSTDVASLKFEDDFVNVDSASDNQEELSNQHLPDSKVYLARLESKLANLKDQAKLSSKQILEGLQQAREFYMNQLLVGARNDAMAFVPEGPEGKSGLISNVERHLFPEKNALTAEELQKLVEDDLLAKNTQQQRSGDDESSDVDVTR